MFIPIEDYIQKTREERRQHLALSNACIEIGGHSSTVFKGLLAYHLKTTIPTRIRVLLCHACNNAACSNPDHLYWGTDSDNRIDYVTSEDFKPSTYNKSTKRIDHARQMGRKQGGYNRFSAERRQEIINLINASPKEWGWKSRLAIRLGVSHTQMTRYLNMFR